MPHPPLLPLSIPFSHINHVIRMMDMILSQNPSYQKSSQQSKPNPQTMAMKAVDIPSPAVDFDFNGGSSSRCFGSPPSPRGFGTQFYFSAPTSPARAATIYRDAFGADSPRASPSGLPEAEDDFSFSFPALATPDEGNIPSAKIPTTMSSHGTHNVQKGREVVPLHTPLIAPLSPKTAKSQRKMPFWSSFLPKKRKDKPERTEQERGRERGYTLYSSASPRRSTRSLSPARVSRYPWEEEQRQQQKMKQSGSNMKPPASPATELPASSSKGSRRWRLKDFLLFRSASEGRTSDKDPFKKYATAYRKQDDTRSSAHQAIANPPPSPRRTGKVSAHEMHYTFNKAVSEDLKKKTFLPYKQGILGRLAVNPTVHALANSFGSLA
ncbi:hypothetical protein Drorol1_Dr00006688 [Drosera rotundifolia]